MASTSVHLPPDLLTRLDRLARETGVSRNKLIVRACEVYVDQARTEWPEDFFSDKRLSLRDRRELQNSFQDWLDQISASRRNRATPPF